MYLNVILCKQNSEAQFLRAFGVTWSALRLCCQHATSVRRSAPVQCLLFWETFQEA